MVGQRGDDGLPPIVRVDEVGDIAPGLEQLKLLTGLPVLVLVGGAAGMNDEDVATLDAVLRRAVVAAVEDAGAAVVDGGTDTGVMRSIGRARAETGAGFPLVGVAAAGTGAVPGGEPPIDDAAELEPHHTQVVLVPGRTAIAAAPGASDPDPRAARIARSPLTSVVAVHDVDAVRAAVVAGLS